MKKRLMTIWMTALFVLLIVPVFAVSARAASKDVTGKMARDKDLKRISKMVSAYTTAIDLSENSFSTTGKIKLNNANKLSIAAFIRFNYKDDIGYTAKELKNETKNLFGKKVGTASIKKAGKNNLLVCTSNKKYVQDPYMYCGGEFGDTIPKYKIQKVTKLNKNTYRVVIQNKIGSYGEKAVETLGTTTVQLKKNNVSKYGYNIKSIEYKR